MYYQSTRGGGGGKSSAEVMAQGIADDGGLFVPETFPELKADVLAGIVKSGYAERAAYILGLFLSDFSREELSRHTREAYSAASFDHTAVAPLKKLDGNTYFLELWHGPTCAFKDMALQVFPRLLPPALRKNGEKREACVLVATSGDTGKAALEGFMDVPSTRIMVFYPRDGVSDVQKLQMITQDGGNVNVMAVEGNFDDAQTGVKAIFSDRQFADELSGRGFFLTSANSINWGRLCPQIVYYVSAYCDLLASGSVAQGEKVNFCVPTGNFGNILAAFYAKKLGLPINKLICASNSNNVLSEFIKSGVYDRKRPFYTTISPSMDILISSNLERLLFELSGKDGSAVAGYMKSLSESGCYEVPAAVRESISGSFAGGECSEEDTKLTIARVFGEHKYLLDTHTAVGYKVLGDYRAETGDLTPAVVVATASPFKFCESVLEALGDKAAYSGAEAVGALEKKSGCTAPAPLAALHGKNPRFTGMTAIEGMKNTVRDFLRG